MKSVIPSLRPISRIGLHIQGYSCFSDKELAYHAFGIRFAYLVCGLLVFLGLATQSHLFYFIAWVLAAGGIVLPRNPIDYSYNVLVRHLLKYPAIPMRSRQNKFACMVLTAWLSGVIAFSLSGFAVWAAAMVGAMLMQVVIVTAIDICFASIIYNLLIN